MSVIVLQFNLFDIYSAGLAFTVRMLTLLVLTLMIIGMVGFLLANHDAVKNVEERYKNALQGALGTGSYYHVWVNKAKEMRIAEGNILKELNPPLLWITLTAGLISLVYLLATYPKPHPFYQLFAPQWLSIWLTIVFISRRRKARSENVLT